MVTVNNASELTTQLNAATGGETIELAAGVNFGDYSTPSGKSYSTPVTITSLDTNNPGVFRSLLILSNKLTFDDVKLDYTYSPGDTVPAFFIIEASSRSDIILRNSEIIGDLDSDGENNATGRGFYMNGGSNVTIEDNYFHNMHDGLDFRQVTNITVTGNEFKSLGSDGAQVMSCTNVTITDNHLHQWENVRTSGHVDAIQMLRQFGGIDTITISRNVFDMADGYWGQMLWSGADGFAMDDAFYRHNDVTIEDNIIYGGSITCIAINGVDNYTLRNNLIQEAQSSTPNHSTPLVTVYTGTTGVTIENNIWPGTNSNYPFDPGYTVSNNHVVTKANWGASGQLIAQAVGDVDGYHDLQINSGAAYTGNAGSRMAKRTGGWGGAELYPHASYQGGNQGAVPLPVLPSGSVSATVTVP